MPLQLNLMEVDKLPKALHPGCCSHHALEAVLTLPVVPSAAF